MNAKHLFAAIAALAVAGSAFADNNAVAGKTRAEVLAELQQAQANGTYVIGGEPFVNQTIATPYRPNSQEATAVASGKQEAAPTVAKTSGKTRAEVIAELKQAQADGTYVVGGSEFAFPDSMIAKRPSSDADTMEARGKKPAAGSTGG